MHRKHLIKLLGLSVLAIVGVMAVTAASASAALEWLLLLNGEHKTTLTLDIKVLPGYMTAENGLKVACEGGSGSVTGTEKEEEAPDGALNRVTGSASITFEECVWVGSEGVCTINDGGEGLIKASGTGEAQMLGEETVVSAESAEFTTIFTEGVFCTVPEEEVVSGSAHVTVDNASTSQVSHSGDAVALSLKLGNSKVTELVGEVHVTDLADPTKTWAIDLVTV